MTHNKVFRYAVLGVFLLAVVTVAGAPLLARAQQGQTPPGQNEFVPVKDLPRQEDLPAAPLVMGSYAFVWVVLIVYVWSVSRRLGKVQGEIDELRRRGATRK